jgi:hypothetical protein
MSSPIAVVAQLQGYFHDPRAPVTVALAPEGTVFQQRVWKALRAIPAGTVLTYGELAARLGTAARAIGGACRSNPVYLLDNSKPIGLTSPPPDSGQTTSESSIRIDRINPPNRLSL